MSRRVIFLAAAAVLVLVVVLALATLHRAPMNPNAVLPADAYSPQLEISNIQLSEATNGTGGKIIYVDGGLQNKGSRTLKAATVQVEFHSGDGTAPHEEMAPLTLVRTRQPYVDLEPIAAEPLQPGGRHDFRLIFEAVPANWDQKPPLIRIIHVETR